LRRVEAAVAAIPAPSHPPSVVLLGIVMEANGPWALVRAGGSDKIMHARLVVDKQVFMGMDTPPDRFQKPQGFHLNIGVKNPVEAERVFNALAEDGKVQMPLQQTFWTVRFGMLIDRFGIPWMINCEQAA